jgi:D-alanyl-D-alanine carboxypeptidase
MVLAMTLTRTCLALCALAVLFPAVAAAHERDHRVKRDLQRLVAAEGGPPGAIATLYRDGRLTSITAGVARVGGRYAPRASDHMRLASVSKAFSAAVALQLVQEGSLALDDTIALRLPDLPRAWGAVTVRQLLNHTSGVPDYTRSAGFRKQLQTAPRAYVSPRKVISWVAGRRLVFRPGSRFAYSNTDNIIVGLMAERITFVAYGELLRRRVFEPLGLGRTSFPATVRLPRPFLHGYLVEPGAPPQDFSEFLNPSGAWASGAIVSTPAELNAFVRGLLGGRLFGAAERAEQLRFVRGGRSSPPGPGRNAAGLGVFRYRSRCGTVYGHTGNFPGYVQWAAATSDGRRSVTSSLNIPAPKGRLLARLRAMQADAVCALRG